MIRDCLLQNNNDAGFIIRNNFTGDANLLAGNIMDGNRGPSGLLDNALQIDLGGTTPEDRNPFDIAKTMREWLEEQI